MASKGLNVFEAPIPAFQWGDSVLNSLEYIGEVLSAIRMSHNPAEPWPPRMAFAGNLLNFHGPIMEELLTYTTFDMFEDRMEKMGCKVIHIWAFGADPTPGELKVIGAASTTCKNSLFLNGSITGRELYERISVFLDKMIT